MLAFFGLVYLIVIFCVCREMTASLYEKGYLIRENGKRNGNWKILFPNPPLTT